MDPKREMTSVDLAALVGELSRYEGAKVDKAYLYGDDLVRLKLRHFDHGRVELLLETGDRKRCHTTDPDRVPDAPDRPPEFAKTLRSRIAGGEFAGVEQFEFDRILRFDFERPDGDTTIVAELFGDGNVAVLDEHGEVLRSLETVRLKSRTVAPGAVYEYPASRINPLNVSFEAFEFEMSDSDTDVVRTLATQLNFGGLYGEEICTRAGVEKTLDIADATEDHFRALYDAIGRMAERLASGDLDPRLYEEDGEVVDVTPLPLEEHADLDATAFDNFNAALDEYFRRLEADQQQDTDTKPQRPDFESEIAKQQRIIDQQEGAIENFEEQAQAERERAELLYANYDLVDEILSTVRGARAEGTPWDEIEETLSAGAEQGIPAAEAVVSLDGSEGMVTIEIDDTRIELVVDDGVEKNADRLYQEAKRVEEKKEGAQQAIENTREELETVRERKRRWEEADGHPDADGDDADGDGDGDEDGESETDWLSEPSIPLRTTEEWYERFRWFHTSDGFLVIGGRNADQNEEIVKKYLNSNDLFFHSQAHGGPVTVLKATGPSEPSRDVDIPETSKEEAAQFAVAYSSVWKDGRGAGDAYMVTPDQVSKTPESGEYLEKGGFVIRGDRTYFRDMPARVAVGIQAEDVTQVIGGPPSAIEADAVTTIELQPGKFAQNDTAVKCYREFKSRFADASFVRKVASADKIQEFLPPGGSELLDI
jgi:predicted ribosome quality control (RQC) complex YloA/Tae2 family protein